jgi:hypothetical protein
VAAPGFQVGVDDPGSGGPLLIDCLAFGRSQASAIIRARERGEKWFSRAPAATHEGGRTKTPSGVAYFVVPNTALRTFRQIKAKNEQQFYI